METHKLNLGLEQKETTGIEFSVKQEVDNTRLQLLEKKDKFYARMMIGVMVLISVVVIAYAFTN